ncbi:MAG TPA: hypothetical protein VJP78_16065 [Thermoleophilia bacterium]|nr:hypothetical protein [Thermoleophilia bacterium]
MKFFHAHRFFGFIDGEDGHSYFLHGRNLEDAPQRHNEYINLTIATGTPCEFDVEPSRDGRDPIAVHVKLLRTP